MYPPHSLLHMHDEFTNQLEKNHHEAYYRYDTHRIQQQLQLGSYQDDFFVVRYAMKANSNPEILALVQDAQIGIDACSVHEAELALQSGFAPHKIHISSQQSVPNRKQRTDLGVDVVCTSLQQLKDFCMQCPGQSVGIRINPGVGSGQFAQITTGGVTSSFGIWHAYLPQVRALAAQANIRITKLHIHIGSGADLSLWKQIFTLGVDLVDQFPDAHILNMGGGYKVARMPEEQSTDLPGLITFIREQQDLYYAEKGHHLTVEIEPGNYFVAPFGNIITIADDLVDTGPDGYQFVKTTTGMDMFLRPALYHAQHPIYHFSRPQNRRSGTGSHQYCFVGHCCESTDVFTKDASGNLAPRGFDQPIQRGDLIVIGGCGAYTESMCCKGYNGFSR